MGYIIVEKPILQIEGSTEDVNRAKVLPPLDKGNKAIILDFANNLGFEPGYQEIPSIMM